MLTGLRKFLFMLALLIVCALLTAYGKIDASGFAEILKFTVPAFMGANLLEHINVKKK